VAESILVVEDEKLVRQLLTLNLSHAGYAVTAVSTWAEGDSALRSGRFDLAVLDLMLPGGEGISLAERARAHGVQCPILMLTARGETATKVRGLNAGADDYVTKPFDMQELLARVRALLRRAGGAMPVAGERLEFGRCWIRFDTGQASSNEGEVVLSPKELKLMQHLARHEDQVLSRTELLEEVWGMDAFPTDRTVDNFILRLRRLFEPDPDQPVHLVTVRGRGYLFRRAP
jgi:DNA-binding response OmpR family regulator